VINPLAEAKKTAPVSFFCSKAHDPSSASATSKQKPLASSHKNNDNTIHFLPHCVVVGSGIRKRIEYS
jgi:hypothetical protein